MYAISFVSAKRAYVNIRPAAIPVSTPRIMSVQFRLPILRISFIIISESRMCIYVLPSDYYVIQPKTALLSICGFANPLQILAIKSVYSLYQQMHLCYIKIQCRIAPKYVRVKQFSQESTPRCTSE